MKTLFVSSDSPNVESRGVENKNIGSGSYDLVDHLAMAKTIHNKPLYKKTYGSFVEPLYESLNLPPSAQNNIKKELNILTRKIESIADGYS